MCSDMLLLSSVMVVAGILLDCVLTFFPLFGFCTAGSE
jgi:hypothetical protein